MGPDLPDFSRLLLESLSMVRLSFKATRSPGRRRHDSQLVQPGRILRQNHPPASIFGVCCSMRVILSIVGRQGRGRNAPL
jgi:hypothetical protein